MGAMPETTPVRVLVVDDSAFMRKMISEILTRAGMQVVANARDGIDALEKAHRLRPDVITLDVEMPRMDGVAFLGELMPALPTPVLVLSSLTSENAETTIQCLEQGAFDCLLKPSGAISLDIETIGAEIVERVQAAVQARRNGLWGHRVPKESRPLLRSRWVVSGKPCGRHGSKTAVVVIAASTGGPGALQQVVPHLPSDLAAAVIIVQHLPVGFTAALAKRLDASSQLCVREAQAGHILEPGTALVAPAGWHLALDATGCIQLDKEPPIWGVRPAADVTLRSAAEHFGPQTMAVILTGMGRDGAMGAKAVRQRGGRCIAQNEATSVVFGMPRAALEAEAVDRLLPLGEIAGAIVEFVAQRGEHIEQPNRDRL
jgi:two-component system chemotaxis response regulator CheB